VKETPKRQSDGVAERCYEGALEAQVVEFGWGAEADTRQISLGTVRLDHSADDGVAVHPAFNTEASRHSHQAVAADLNL